MKWIRDKNGLVPKKAKYVDVICSVKDCESEEGNYHMMVSDDYYHIWLKFDKQKDAKAVAELIEELSV